MMSRTFSADESFFKIMDVKAIKAGVSPSYLLRAMIQEFLVNHDLVKGPDDLFPRWVKREGGTC